MFGYIKPDISELKVKDYELYKATYCGLCRTMGKRTGCLSKMTLSYDFAFLALLRMVADKTKGEIKMRRCIAHPFKKRPILEINEGLLYCARTSTILTRLKLRDNVNDSHGLKRLKAKLATLVTVFFKKTDKSLLPLEEKIQALIDTLTVLEKEDCDSLDRLASTFGELLGELSSYGYEGGTKRLLYEIGFHLGKWIYVIDACDDFNDDVKSGSFNVFKNLYGDTIPSEARENIKCALFLELDKMSKSVELIDFNSHRDVENIIRNVIFIGMRDVTEALTQKNKDKKLHRHRV